MESNSCSSLTDNLQFSEGYQGSVSASVKLFDIRQSKITKSKNKKGEFKDWEPVFEKYLIVEQLGTGSFGEVVKA